MLPQALLNAPNMDDWTTLSEVSRMIGKPAPSYAYLFIIDNKVASIRMFGQLKYYKPDVEAALARLKVAA